MKVLILILIGVVALTSCSAGGTDHPINRIEELLSWNVADGLKPAELAG